MTGRFDKRPIETVFALRLMDVRERESMTYNQMAAKCCVTDSSVYRWLDMRFEPSLDLAFKVACAFGYSLDDMTDPGVESIAPAFPAIEQSWAPPRLGFGRALQEAMRGMRLTDVEVSRRVGVSRPRVSNWKHGHAMPRLTSAARVADELGLSLHGMCCGDVVERHPAPVPRAIS
jgi:transcriptional regulator with XRE-family HTH domain